MDGCARSWASQIIAARSPQAKGRVERNHGTHQDRLIKKMRRKKIRTHEQANCICSRNICRSTTGGSGARRRRRRTITGEAPSAAELREVFRLESERTIGNDWVVRYDNRLFQVQAQSRKYAPAQGKVVVCEWQDGTMSSALCLSDTEHGPLTLTAITRTGTKH